MLCSLIGIHKLTVSWIAIIAATNVTYQVNGIKNKCFRDLYIISV
jgi:hypothetical protein